MKYLILGLFIINCFIANNIFAAEVVINGAGASFPYPIYSKWGYEYNKLTGVKINYQSIGSGGGIAQIKAKTVDFGASDTPLSKTELDTNNLIQFPMVIGGVVPIINIKGIKSEELNLTPILLADIYLGKIKTWNDPAIKAINANLKLPSEEIKVVGRADGSGTTWIFTNYLDKISTDWHTKIGCNKLVNWPTGVAAKGNEGVAANVQRLNNSIGYVEYAYAIQGKLIYTKLQNKAGKFISPSFDTVQAAASSADWKNAPGFNLVLTDTLGDKSWPITGVSFILLQKHYANPITITKMLAYFTWALENGSTQAKALDYVALPSSVISLIKDTWKKDLIINK